jgi:hypothetical protein
MNRYLHVSFGIDGTKIDDDVLKDIFNKAGDWIRYNNYSWIIYTDKDATYWKDQLKQANKGDISFLVMEVKLDHRNGWITQKIWDWLNKKRD